MGLGGHFPPAAHYGAEDLQVNVAVDVDCKLCDRFHLRAFIIRSAAPGHASQHYQRSRHNAISSASLGNNAILVTGAHKQFTASSHVQDRVSTEEQQDDFPSSVKCDLHLEPSQTRALANHASRSRPDDGQLRVR